jgi:predicted Fe-Mo cluster-binding NifX family protein
MATRVLICLHGDEVNPRFDLTREVMIAVVSETGKVYGQRELVLPHASVETLFNMILSEGIDVVICGAIEKEYYQYLKWKKINVLDSVVGDWKETLKHLAEGRLHAGDILEHP